MSISLNNLAAGIYAGSVKITASGISNSPVTILVQLNVTAPPSLTASPATLSFAYTLLSGTNPPSQSTSITATGGVAIPFSASASTTSGGNWLSVSPGSGTTPGALTVSVNTASLTAGVYSGSVSVDFCPGSRSDQHPGNLHRNVGTHALDIGGFADLRLPDRWLESAVANLHGFEQWCGTQLYGRRHQYGQLAVSHPWQRQHPGYS